ncbi:protein of unknown function [Streptantibioticus cattleyicolor NRRL 8057 = DSM 46488]|nr:protein of unknown function [Streptantibioticus cattleyicolor NRRL 8057 = DSM 46488]
MVAVRARAVHPAKCDPYHAPAAIRAQKKVKSGLTS